MSVVGTVQRSGTADPKALEKAEESASNAKAIARLGCGAITALAVFIGLATGTHLGAGVDFAIALGAGAVGAFVLPEIPSLLGKAKESIQENAKEVTERTKKCFESSLVRPYVQCMVATLKSKI